MDRGDLTGCSNAVQYNVTIHFGSLNERLLETRILFSWSTPRLLSILGLVCSSVKFCNHSSDATSISMSFIEELVLKVNLEDPFFTRRLRMFSLNNTIKINGNQTIGGQYNFT
jgi:hypothetical protein